MDKKSKLMTIISYGCQMNLSDAERMEGQLATLGYQSHEGMEEADLIIINTCCVRESAEDKVYGKIGEIKALKRKNPKLIFGITGCMAQKEGERLRKRAPHIDFVLGTNKIHEIAGIVASLEEEELKHFVDTSLKEEEMPEGLPINRRGSLSAWIPIMYGCNNFCTYCIVPYVRGRERSRLPEDILEEIRQAAKEGYKEITLLGQNVNSYGKDHKLADFADLLKMADEVEGIERIRYMTSHPKDLSDKVIKVIAESRHICKHFHLPVQHGSNKILKAMNRVYKAEEYLDLVARIRKAVPEASLTTDIIVGFPGETDQDFAELLSFMQAVGYDQAYTFIYSKRSGTPAAQMEMQVADEIKHQRLEALMKVQNEISLQKNKELEGKEVEVLVEGPSHTDQRVWTGRTDTNKIVLWQYQGKEQTGDIIDIKITQAQTWLLKGEYRI